MFYYTYFVPGLPHVVLMLRQEMQRAQGEEEVEEDLVSEGAADDAEWSGVARPSPFFCTYQDYHM